MVSYGNPLWSVGARSMPPKSIYCVFHIYWQIPLHELVADLPQSRNLTCRVCLPKTSPRQDQSVVLVCLKHPRDKLERSHWLLSLDVSVSVSDGDSWQCAGCCSCVAVDNTSVSERRHDQCDFEQLFTVGCLSYDSCTACLEHSLPADNSTPVRHTHTHTWMHAVSFHLLYRHSNQTEFNVSLTHNM